jgi:hypothetical protein
MENPQSWNRYAYVYNNPLRYNDPDGHCPCLSLSITLPVIALALLTVGTIYYTNATPEGQRLKNQADATISRVKDNVVELAKTKLTEAQKWLIRATTDPAVSFGKEKIPPTIDCKTRAGRVVCRVIVTFVVATVAIAAFCGIGQDGEATCVPKQQSDISTEPTTVVPALEPTETPKPADILSPNEVPEAPNTSPSTQPATGTPSPVQAPAPYIVPKPGSHTPAIPI